MPKALEGVRVLENTSHFAGPFCGMMLADLGAEEIRIESMKSGKHGRRGTIEKEIRSLSGSRLTYFQRNKKSIALNLKTEKGVEIFKDLVKVSDVVLENYAPGVMNRLGVGYEALKEVNPVIIYCSITGYGLTGPDWNKRGFDVTIKGRSGLMSVTGPPNLPTRVGNSISDYLGGLNATIAILAALHYREKTGRGQRLDIAMFDCVAAVVERSTNPQSRASGYGRQKCKDGFIMTGILGELIWARFCKLIDREDIIAKYSLSRREGREEDIEIVSRVLEEWMTSKTCDEAVKSLTEAGIPAEHIQVLPEVIKDPQLIAREMFVEVYDPELMKKTRVIGSPFKMSETPGNVERGFPALGEHTEEILVTLLRYDEMEIAKLKEEGILV